MRLSSLDVFRGITIAAMILANMAGVADDVYRPLSQFLGKQLETRR